MKPWFRRQINQLCLHAGEPVEAPPIEFGGVPADEFFGATGLAGDSGLASDSGHRHAMPDVDDLLTDDILFIEELVMNDPTLIFNKIGVIPVVDGIGGYDDVGPAGGFGTATVQTGVANQGSASLFLQNIASGSASASLQNHLWQRVKELIIRCTPGKVSSDLSLIKFVVGGWRSTTAGTSAVAPYINALSDGVFFYLETDVNGDGFWECRALNNTALTSVVTTVEASTDFKQFLIAYDHATTTATFVIDDVQVGTISTNIPPATRKLAGFGPLQQAKDNGGTRVIGHMVDRFVYRGWRVAPT